MTRLRPGTPSAPSLLAQYGCGPVQFSGTTDALYERHLLFDSVRDVGAAGARERFEAVARSVRDVLSQRWIRTEQTYDRENPKRVYYLSMEFLIGRSLANNVMNGCSSRSRGMANLAIAGSHSTNGVAAIHSELLRKTTVRGLAELFPERFNNKPNGVTPRRWLRLANPSLARAISDAIPRRDVRRRPRGEAGEKERTRDHVDAGVCVESYVDASDRTIADYAAEIWNAKPCVVP